MYTKQKLRSSRTRINTTSGKMLYSSLIAKLEADCPQVEARGIARGAMLLSLLPNLEDLRVTAFGHDVSSDLLLCRPSDRMASLANVRNGNHFPHLHRYTKSWYFQLGVTTPAASQSWLLHVGHSQTPTKPRQSIELVRLQSAAPTSPTSLNTLSPKPQYLSSQPTPQRRITATMPSWKRLKYRRNKKLRARAAKPQPASTGLEKESAAPRPPTPPTAFPKFQVLPAELRLNIWRFAASPPKWQPIRRWVALTYQVKTNTHLMKATRPISITVRPGQPGVLFVNTEAHNEVMKDFGKQMRLLTLAMSDNEAPRQIYFNYDYEILYLPGKAFATKSNAVETMAFWSTSTTIPVEQRDRVRHLAVGYFDETSLSVQGGRLAFCDGLRKFGQLKSLRMVLKKETPCLKTKQGAFERHHGDQPEAFFRRMIEDMRRQHQDFPKVRVMVGYEGSEGQRGQGARRGGILD
ncbi:hypothetical protein BU16DRAFT_545346 [Lophium mytilinum]|uniref:2EXR domain-containing protein n=1 Tax=Lophium mytilinum TaxID=390894 RepID=A0A6A6Q9J9_9PEZI|nr:hypothetical protein BU16DRAFT_545346 [Lophium mytilinum]